MKIVTVIPLKKGIFSENLTYFTTKNIENGSIVSVPLRNQKILGLVIATEEVIDTKSGIKNMSFNLKKIIEVKEHSIFKKEFLESALLTGKYFTARKNDSVAALIPSILKEAYDKISTSFSSVNLTQKKKFNENIRSEKLLLQIPLEDRISLYKTMIRESFARKKSIFIVLPTEHDIENYFEFLSKGIENFSFAVHSGLTSKKIIEKVNNIIDLSHPVLILGTAPYLSIPRNDLETIILEHESSNAYKMFSRPNFDLRIFVEIFASKTGAKLILADSLLRFETLAREELDGLIPMHPINFRINFKGKIEISSREDNREKKFKIINDKNVTEVKDAIARKENIFIFSLRKGLATITTCKDCNETIFCKNCSAPLVLYLSRDGKKRMFVCNRCKKETSPETVCPRCGGWNLTPLGIGTDTVYDAVEKLFTKNTKPKIFKLDKGSIKSTKEAEKIIKEFEENPGGILIGTEMAFYYLKQKVPLSIIASFDSLWSVPNFRMSEKIVQIIMSITSIAKDKLIIQTKNIEDRAILAIKNENLASFIREELEDRNTLSYPPFKRFIKIRYLGDKAESLKIRVMLANIFKEYDPDIFSGFVAKEKNKYITNALIKIDTSKWSVPELSMGSTIDEELFKKLSALPFSFEVSVDPEDLL